LVVVASFFAGAVNFGDEDLVDDELAVKGPPVKTAP
jgi:hypothetical protein